MTPLKLRMTAFGSYIEPVVLDFETGLGDEKIFLIHGATGAGKTTILDAISYALYGETSGKARKGEDMRSKGVADNVKTEVEFTFRLGNEIYRVYRSPAQEFAKKRGGSSKSIPVAAKLYRNEELIATKDRAVKNKVIELIGFTPEQFRQVILLPQGEFKKFLSAEADDRQEILSVLFDTEPYQKIELALAERAKISVAEAANFKTQCETFENQLKEMNAESQSVEEVAEKLSEAKQKVIALKKLFDAAQIQLTDGNILADKFAELQKITFDLNSAQIQFAEAEKNFEAAQSEYQQHEGEEYQLKELEQNIADLKKIQDMLVDLQNKNLVLDIEQKRLQEAQKNFETYADRAKRYDERLDDLALEKVKLMGADVKFAKMKILSDRATRRDALLKEISRRQKTLEMEQSKLALVAEKFTAAQIELNRLQIVHSAAHLATQLKDGEPCPVCGSLEHPAIIAEAIPSAAELHAAEKKVTDLSKEKENQQRTVSKIIGELSARENQLQDYSDVPDTATVRKNFDEAQEESKALAECQRNIDKGNIYIKENRAAFDAADKAKNSAKIAVARLEGAISESKQKVPEKYRDNEELLDDDLGAVKVEFKLRDTAWKFVQKNFNSAKETKSARAATLHSVQKNFDALQAQVKDKTPPDLDSLNQQAKAANANLNAAIVEAAKLEAAFNALKEISAKRDAVKAKLVIAQKEADMWRRLSDVANATGKGEAELKISFQRYYLSTMFNEVVNEANNRLTKMSNGRYLFRMKDVGSTMAKKAGLNLEIFDEYTSTTRPVETLSGGESFLASLSLALGLAAVVQNRVGGIKLDTIFIDEGFGSLDMETLDCAVSTIIEQSGGRLVGIISHVEELKKQMPVRLEVKKSGIGSTAEFNTKCSIISSANSNA